MKVDPHLPPTQNQLKLDRDLNLRPTPQTSKLGEHVWETCHRHRQELSEQDPISYEIISRTNYQDGMTLKSVQQRK